ncbi:MAG: hypothetical protein IAA25_01010 [Candidatus Ruminococcus intestinipullorum]|nr:hypothetical protein [Candidatus Ruminococcus intestinipullorum]
MKNSFKWFLALVSVGTALGLILTVFFKKKSSNCKESSPCVEEEDFDLDDDLQPVSKREYVPLNKTSDSDNTETVDNSTEEELVEEEPATENTQTNE